MERLPLLFAVLVMFLLRRSYETALEKRPQLEQDTLRVLQHGQGLAFVFLGLLVVSELARVQLHLRTPLALSVPPAFGLAGAAVQHYFQWHAHRTYELAAEDPDDEGAVRARAFQRRIYGSFAASVVVWSGVILERALRALP